MDTVSRRQLFGTVHRPEQREDGPRGLVTGVVIGWRNKNHNLKCD